MLKQFHKQITQNLNKFFLSTGNYPPINLHYDKLEIRDKQKSLQQNNLLVLHGVMGNTKNFHNLMLQNKQLRQLSNIYLLDARNHGQSPWTEEMTFPLMADDVAYFIEKQQLNNIFLLGHSMGGKTLMTLLCKHPQLYSKIKGTIIIDMLPVNFMYGKHAQQFEKEKQFFGSLATLQLNELKNLPLIKKEILKICEGNQNQANYLATNILVEYKNNKPFYSWQLNIQSLFANLSTLWKFVPSYTIFQNNNRYQKPFKIILGEKSHLTSSNDSKNSYRLIFDKKEIDKNIITIKNATHFVPFEKPLEFFKIVIDFINTNK